MSLRKIPENEPVTGSEAGNDDDVLAPIRLAAQRSFDRRRREAAAANSANAGHGHGHLPASPGAESLAAPRLRRTISMPVSGAYSQALKTAKSIMAQLRIPQGAHPPRQIAGSNPSAPSGSQAPLRPAALTASSSDIAAPVFQRTMSSPIRGRSASRHTNVRSFSDASGETQKYRFRDLLPAKTAASLRRLSHAPADAARAAVAALAAPADLAAAPESALLNYALELSLREAQTPGGPEDDDAGAGDVLSAHGGAGGSSSLKTVEQLMQEQSSGDLFGAATDGVAAEAAKKKEKKEKKKKKKKKKGGFSYKNYIKNALSSKTTEEEQRELQRDRIARSLGGGEFAKHTKL